jgi:hypothetical protein
MEENRCIEYFNLEIKPYHFADRAEIELHIRVDINGTKYGYVKILFPDDLTSLCDRLFDMAKHTLKEEISKKNKKGEQNAQD